MPCVHYFKHWLVAAWALAATTNAHGLVRGFNTDGQYNDGFSLDYYYKKINTGSFPTSPGWYQEALDQGFVSPNAFGTPDIICHIKADNANTNTATVSAGGTVDFFWNTWPTSHFGPILTYVAACGTDCATVDKTQLQWVKIDEVGYDAATKSWPTPAFMANNFTSSVKVPATLASGPYVFRHELIALHGAGGLNGAQNYPMCVNIEITGGGSDTPSGTLGTELYKADDPGILFEPYKPFSNYPMPGPPLYTGDSAPKQRRHARDLESRGVKRTA